MSAFSQSFAEARASLLSNKLRTSLMMLAIVVGVAALSAVICIGQGTREKILGLVEKHGLDTIMVRAGGEKQILAPTADRNIVSLNEDDAQAIEAEIPNIALVSAVQNARGWQVTHGDKSVTVRVFGVGPDWADIRHRPLVRGQFIDQGDMVGQAKIAILGYRTAQILYGDLDPIGQTVRLNNEPFRVKGVFSEVGANAGGEDFDDRIVVPVTTTAKRLFGRPYLEQIIIRVRKIPALGDTAEKIRTLLRERHNTRAGADNFFVRVPEDVKEFALATSSTLDRLLLALSILVLLVGGGVIMNLMLISVTQRTHEIGLRRSLGASQSDILRQFLLEALLVTLAAGVLGALLGAGIATFLDWRGLATSKVTWLPFAVSIGACSLLALAFGLYPARKAARIDPASALGQKRL